MATLLSRTKDEPTGLARDLAQAASAAPILCLGPAPRVQAMISGGRKDQPQLLNWAQWHAAYDMSAFLLSPFPALLHHPLAQVDYRRSRHQSVRLGGLSRAQTRRVAGIVTSRVMSPYVTALPSRWRLQPSWVAGRQVSASTTIASPVTYGRSARRPAFGVRSPQGRPRGRRHHSPHGADRV